MAAKTTKPSIKQQSFDLQFNNDSYTRPSKSVAKKHYDVKTFSALCLSAACVVILTITSYKAIKYSKIPSDINSIPLVEATTINIRTIPEDPGGIIVNNQDKLIYDRIAMKKDADENKVLRTAKRAKTYKSSLKQKTSIKRKASPFDYVQ